MISSWPGLDPAIHVYHRPPGVDHRVKPGDDDFCSLALFQGEGVKYGNLLIKY